MQCNRCSAENPDGATICASCGSPINRGSEAENSGDMSLRELRATITHNSGGGRTFLYEFGADESAAEPARHRRGPWRWLVPLVLVLAAMTYAGFTFGPSIPVWLASLQGSRHFFSEKDGVSITFPAGYRPVRTREFLAQAQARGGSWMGLSAEPAAEGNEEAFRDVNGTLAVLEDKRMYLLDGETVDAISGDVECANVTLNGKSFYRANYVKITDGVQTRRVCYLGIHDAVWYQLEISFPIGTDEKTIRELSESAAGSLRVGDDARAESPEGSGAP